MRHDLDAALDQCLTWLREGMDSESCLDRYPEYAAELRPLLELAVDVVRVRVPAPPVGARAAGQRRMLAAMAQKQERLARVHAAVLFVRRMLWSLVPGTPGSLRPAWQLAAVLLLVLLLASGWMTVAASADSLPGDVLYPVKLASQRAQLALVLNPAKHRLLADQYETQQRLDVQTVLKGQRQVAVEFQGVLQQMERSLWVVGGLPVVLRETTTIIGQPDLGAKVDVQAYLPGNGQLVARWLRVESTTTTTPEPRDIGQPSATPTRTHTPEFETPKPTRTLESAATVGASETPTPSDTSDPIETPEPDGAPEHEGTADPAETPEPDDTDEHEETPDPTETPRPDRTREHGGTSDPTDTSKPDRTREHEGTPDPADTSKPDRTREHEGTPDPTDTSKPDRTREHEGIPGPTQTPDPGGTREREGPPHPTRTPEPDGTREHDGIPDPTEEPDD